MVSELYLNKAVTLNNKTTQSVFLVIGLGSDTSEHHSD